MPDWTSPATHVSPPLDARGRGPARLEGVELSPGGRPPHVRVAVGRRVGRVGHVAQEAEGRGAGAGAGAGARGRGRDREGAVEKTREKDAIGEPQPTLLART